MRDLSTATLGRLQRAASHHSKVAHEAEDLVQDVLVAAIESGRDCGARDFVAWASGAIRLRAKFIARSAGRRKRLDALHEEFGRTSSEFAQRLPDEFVSTLPRSLRIVASLANLGMGRREIAYLLGLTDTGFRQRISGLRRAVAKHGGMAGLADGSPSIEPETHGGMARRRLKASLPRIDVRRFAIRDPDGLPIFFADAHVSEGRGNS